MNDISEAYENRKFAPALTATEINRLHKGYIGTYWQEITTRTLLLGLNYELMAATIWWIAIGCAAQTAMHKLMGDKRRMDQSQETPVVNEIVNVENQQQGNNEDLAMNNFSL